MTEDDLAPERSGRRVHVDDDRVADAADRLDGPLDEVPARRGEHHDGDVLGGDVGVRDEAHEVIIRLRGGGVPDLDLLVAHGDHELEEVPLARGVHRLGQRLVAVAQVHRHPEWGFGEASCRPLAVDERHVDAGEQVLVAVGRHL